MSRTAHRRPGGFSGVFHADRRDAVREIALRRERVARSVGHEIIADALHAGSPDEDPSLHPAPASLEDVRGWVERPCSGDFT